MISIITPSFNQLEWLRLAVASAGDQEGVAVEQIVQDAGTPGIEQFLRSHFRELVKTGRLRLFVEKDSGMYDAVNRGLRRAEGSICAYLNCDEQYLPGALVKVGAAFAANPGLDLLLAGTLVVDRAGSYVCSRPPLQPSLAHLRAGRMYNLTSSIFFRARLLRERSLFFDPKLRIVGDRDWLRRVVESGVSIQTLDLMTSTFSDLGTNLALSAGGVAERNSLLDQNRTWPRRLSAAAAIALHRLRRLFAGQYHPQPFSYSIYTLSSPDKRQIFEVKTPTGVWRNRL